MENLELKDFFLFSPSAGRGGSSSTDPDVRQQAASGKGLKIEIIASHAGMVNGNKTMYSPQGMKNSAHTWTYPIARPVQIHHDDHADPIGRVIGARFRPFNSEQHADAVRDHAILLRDASTKTDLKDAVALLEDSGVLAEDTWSGVGELILEAMVTDSSAVEKILDGRYLGVSISQRPKQAFCSLCWQDWIKDGRCEHERGEVDEESGKTMYLVVGDTKYGEVSPVNGPADEHALITNAELVSTETTAQVASFDEYVQAFGDQFDSVSKGAVSFQIIDSLEEDDSMTTKTDKKDKVTDELESQDDKTTDDSTKESDEDQNKIEEEVKDSDEEESEDGEDTKTTIEEALKILFEDRDNLTGFMCDILFDALEELIEGDAKLSTQKRKSLPSSAFCGPERSFPVNDAEHYTAAKKLLGTYDGGGDKSEILSCVEKKGKALGCSCEEKKDEQTEETITDETNSNEFVLTDLDDSTLGTHFLDVSKEMAGRGLSVSSECKECKGQLAQIDQMTGEISDLQGTSKVLREEWQAVTFEHVASEDAHSETLNKLRDSQKVLVVAYRLLTETDSNQEVVNTEVEALSSDELASAVEKVDFSKVISFLKSGISNKPTEKVTTEDANDDADSSDSVDVKLAETLVKFATDFGHKSAEGYLRRKIRDNELPEGFTLDKAFEIMAE